MREAVTTEAMRAARGRGGVELWMWGCLADEVMKRRSYLEARIDKAYSLVVAAPVRVHAPVVREEDRATAPPVGEGPATTAPAAQVACTAPADKCPEALFEQWRSGEECVCARPPIIERRCWPHQVATSASKAGRPLPNLPRSARVSERLLMERPHRPRARRHTASCS